MSKPVPPLPDTATEMVQRIMGFVSGQFVFLMIHVGDRLGLYAALHEHGKMSAAELAQRTGLQQRWLLEWLRGQAGAGLVKYHDDDRFSIVPDVIPVLVDANSPSYLAGFFARTVPTTTIEHIISAFENGLGMSYAAHGTNCACTLKRLTTSGHSMLPTFLSRIDTLTEQLNRGIYVVDVGCGTGVALQVLAKVFPNSRYEGYDPSPVAIEVAKRETELAELANITYHVAGGEELPPKAEFDLALTLDCLHDVPFPQQVLNAIRDSLKPEGTLVVKDIRCSAETAENIAHPQASLLYGLSMLYCMNSALSQPGGAGLGTMGLNPPLLKKMAKEAGFAQVDMYDFEEDSFNYFYALRGSLLNR